jgi:membrane protein DedA with SNARE-associated domain
MPLLSLLADPDFLSGFFEDFSYSGPFLVLLLCGLGLPLPEEVTLIGSGILLYRGEVEFLPIVLVCSAAILIGDSIPYWLGRRYGMAALQIRWVARVLHPERFARMERRFEEHGNWAVFVCRFFAGVRIPGYFLAGTMGMRYSRFLLLDSLGVALSVPISIWAGAIFGGQVDRLQQTVSDLHLILAFLALSLALILVLRYRRQRARQAYLARTHAERLRAVEQAVGEGDPAERAAPPGDPAD